MGKKKNPPPAPAPAPTTGTDGNDQLIISSLNTSIDGRGGFDTAIVQLGFYNEAVIMSGALGSGTTARLSSPITSSAAGLNVSLTNIEQLSILTGAGSDQLFGGAGNDRFFTNGGDDIVNGGAGADYFDLGTGANRATGGSGADTFFLTDGGVTTITDFNQAEGDRLYFFLDAVDIPIPFAFQNGFLRVVDTADGAAVQVDQDGATGGANFQTIALLNGVQAASVTFDSFVPI